MIKEIVVCYGAAMRSEGGGTTSITSTDLGNECDHTLSEVDENGAVVRPDGYHYHRHSLQDFGEQGFKITDIQNGRLFQPGKVLKIPLGAHEITITATDQKGVILNGVPSTPLTPEIEKIRYP